MKAFATWAKRPRIFRGCSILGYLTNLKVGPAFDKIILYSQKRELISRDWIQHR
jgi:hypothetical protein